VGRTWWWTARSDGPDCRDHDDDSDTDEERTMGDTQNGQDEQTVSDEEQLEWEGADIDTSKLVGEGSRTVRDEAPDAGERDEAPDAGERAAVEADADTDGAADAEGAEVNDG
jgi:hypothetical protein